MDLTNEQIIFRLRRCWEAHPELAAAADRIQAQAGLLNIQDETLTLLHDELDETFQRYVDANEALIEAQATIARLQDLVVKFQNGGTSILFAEGHVS